ncbi:hypothetical protein AGMMS49579_24540 [Spirochaetia bacterium]|nr:hypothetical protein AGMMS49579_24540 [Spirochaetia bacterium]
MKKTIMIFVIFNMISFCFADNGSIHIKFYSSRQIKFYENYFTYNGIDYTKDNDYIELSINIDILKKIIQLEYINIEIIRDNIININTTRTAEGGPFIRNYMDIDIEEGIIIKKDTEREPMIKYGPTHPDAIKNGPKAGYVLYPNVFLSEEYNNLFESIQLYNSIVEYIHINNIGIIVEKIKMNTFEELDYFEGIKNRLDIYFKLLYENK